MSNILKKIEEALENETVEAQTFEDGFDWAEWLVLELKKTREKVKELEADIKQIYIDQAGEDI